MKTIDFSAMERPELEAYAAQTATENEELKLKLQYYEEQLRLQRAKKFGIKSERTDSNQLSMFNEAEAEADPKAAEPELAQVKTQVVKKKKKKGAKEEICAPLPKRVVEYCLSAEEQVCPECGQPLHEMRRKVRKTLEVIPAKVQVLEEITCVYSCRNCENHGTSTPIIDAPHPSFLLPGSLISPSLAAWILSQKFDDRIPLYKISQDLRLLGVRLSRQTLSNWVVNLSRRYGSLLYERMKEELLKEDIIQADETELQVLNEPGRTAAQKSYMWMFRANRTSRRPIVLYEYADNRRGETAKTFLKGFVGYLQSDGYKGYGVLLPKEGEGPADPDVILVGCMAHLRRYFLDAINALPKNSQASATLEKKGVELCDELFELDAKVKEQEESQRLAYKEQHLRPKLEAFFEWVKSVKPTVRENSKLGKALGYAINQEEYLMNYLLDGRLELSNNASEQAIRPFVMGRKNWLFCNTPNGAQASAVLYSLTITAKENGLNPFEYFRYVFEQIRGIDPKDTEKLDSLLPWSPTLPEVCCTPLQE